MAKFPWRLFLLLGDRVGSTERSLAQRTRTGMLVVHDELGQSLLIASGALYIGKA